MSLADSLLGIKALLAFAGLFVLLLLYYNLFIEIKASTSLWTLLWMYFIIAIIMGAANITMDKIINKQTLRDLIKEERL